jgi:hypothetical protein
MRNPSLRFTVALFASVVCGQAVHAQTSTVHFVATNSVFNGSGCGARERPCRSIAQAVRNASDGDLIEVGPGTYEGTLFIDKAVEIYSTAGASLTVLKKPDPFEFRVVFILAPGVTVGRLGGGFTIIGSKPGEDGSTGTQAIDGGNQSDLTIAGNIIEGHFTALESGGTRGARIEGNTVIDNVLGFEIKGPGIVINNVAIHNERGFFVNSREVTFTDNAAIGNVFGIDVGAKLVNQLSDNTIIGNSQSGLTILTLPPAPGRIVVRRNNIYGNGDAADGCGITNRSGELIDATNNYWGKANGPGPNPGDRAYGTCLASGSILTTPFAAAPFPVAPSSQ